MTRTIAGAVCAAATIVALSFSARSIAQEIPEAPGVHVLPAVPLPAQTSAVNGLGGPLIVPSYSSRPTASAKLYLDFDGDYASIWGAYSPGTTPAYDNDGDPTTFTQGEIDNMHEIWMRVAEAYSPFDIDVTTVDPGSLQDGKVLRAVVGGDGNNGTGSYWVGGRAGGIGYVGGFENSQPNTVYVFPGNLANGTPKYTAMAISHEAGHGFGLNHQSVYSPSGTKLSEYNQGTSDSAPFMGTAYFAARGIWYSGINSNGFIQNDVDIISTANGFGYIPDEAGDTPATAAHLDVIDNSFLAAGVITQITDSDFYSFTTLEDATALFNLGVAPYGAMLDSSLGLFDANGNLLQMVATASLGETLSASLVAGTYELGVFSAGNVGDIGQYLLSGSITPVPEPTTVLLTILCLPLLRRRPMIR